MNHNEQENGERSPDEYNIMSKSYTSHILHYEEQSRYKFNLHKTLEQDKIVNEIIQILGITEENNTIMLYDIEQNEIIKQQLMYLIPAIRQWYTNETIKTILSNKRPYLIIIKEITKKNWEIYYHTLRIFQNNEYIRTQQFTFTKKKAISTLTQSY